MNKIVGLIVLLTGVCSVAMAAVPEIDPASGMSAIAVIAGGLLVIRGRRKQR
jgi:hypothetical protein